MYKYLIDTMTDVLIDVLTQFPQIFIKNNWTACKITVFINESAHKRLIYVSSVSFCIGTSSAKKNKKCKNTNKYKCFILIRIKKKTWLLTKFACKIGLKHFLRQKLSYEGYEKS